MDEAVHDLINETASLRAAVVGFNHGMEELRMAVRDALDALQDQRIRFTEIDGRMAAISLRVLTLEQAVTDKRNDFKSVLLPILSQLIVAALAAIMAVIATHPGIFGGGH